MAAYKRPRPFKASRVKSRWWGPRAGVIFIAVLLVLGLGIIKFTYTDNLKPLSTVQTISYFTVQSGDTVKTIAANLKSAKIIKSAGAFETYVRGNGYHDRLQAGTYSLSPSMSVQTIVSKMIHGEVTRNLLTILPGKTISDIKKAFSKAGYSSAEIETAFNPATYSGDPALANLPAGASLEGYLYPDSFQQATNTPAATIVKESIDEMASYLTPSVRAGFSAHGLSVYQGITLASVVYQETDDPTYEPTVAQVFYLRMTNGMALQSNVTADYAADQAGVPRSTNINSPYNTYLHTGLPPGPIGNVTKQALNAVANPANSDYLYFVADEKTHQVFFSHTPEEHNALAQQHCPNTCQ